MAGATNASVDAYSVIGGILKSVYKDEVKVLVPEWAVVQDKIGFATSEMVGDQYVEAIALTGEHGVTYAQISDGGISLQTPVAMNVQQAKLNPPQIYLQAQLELTMLSRAASVGKAAMASASKLVMSQALLSMRKRLEIALINGGQGLGKCASSVNASSTSTVVTMTTAYYAPGIWAGMENAQLDLFNANTKQNTNAVLVVSAVDLDLRTVTITGNSTDIAAIDTAIAGNANVLDFWFNTAKSGATVKEMTGLHGIVGNTGTLFSIDGSSTGYSQWRGNTFSCSSANLTKANLGKAVAKVFNKGYMGKLLVLGNPLTWNDLEAETGPMRMFDSSYSGAKAEQGSERLVFHSQTGSYEVVAHPMVKEGFAYVFPPEEFKRVGSRDIEIGIPGMPGDAIERIPNTNYLAVPFMTDQALFCNAPSHCVLINNIVNG